MGWRCWLAGVGFDVVAVILTGVTYYLLERGAVSTIKTGFHLDDKNIDYPYTPFEKDFVPADLVTIVSAVLGLLLLAVEFAVAGAKKKWNARRVCARAEWITALRMLLIYLYGLLLTCVVTGVLKVLVGRLRPHFLDLCRPNFTMPATGESRFITEYTCTNPHKVLEKWIQNVYWSFPSGHSSVSAYSCFFFVIYLQLRWHSEALYSTLYKTVPQGVLLAFALIGSYSRVRDHKHHWSDVFVGLILGTIIAAWLALLVAKPLISQSTKRESNSALLPQMSADASFLQDPLSEDTTPAKPLISQSTKRETNSALLPQVSAEASLLQDPLSKDTTPM